MPRKQVGAIDADLLAEVDRRAKWLGQTRRVFIERTLQERLASPDWKLTGSVNPEALKALSVGAPVSAHEPVEVDDDGRVVPYRQHVPGPNVENIRSSSQSKRDVKPYPKGKR